MLIRTTALRFRPVVWGVIAIVLLTGPMLLHQRGISIMNPSGWPMILSIKLGLVAIPLLVTVTRDLIIGPRVGRILQIPAESRTRSDQAMVAWSPWIALVCCGYFLSHIESRSRSLSQPLGDLDGPRLVGGFYSVVAHLIFCGRRWFGSLSHPTRRGPGSPVPPFSTAGAPP